MMNNSEQEGAEEQSRVDHVAKLALRDEVDRYYLGKKEELRLGDVEIASAYLEKGERFFDRGILFAQRGLDSILQAHLSGNPWAVVSGLNPSGPLHLGHKAMFDVLLWLQRDLGAELYIPITNDETYLVGKSASLAQSRRTALTEVIPSIIAFGFDPHKTKIILHSDFPPMHTLATHVSRFTTYNNVRSLFGWTGNENPGTVYYMGGLQFASILLPQVADLGGPKPVLVPVGIDQHPYISLARDVASRLDIVPPAEILWKFLPGLKDPTRKMSTSIPGDAIFLNDTPEQVARKITRSFSGGVPLLSVHKELGAVPEVCAAFQLLTYTLEDQSEWQTLREGYATGRITARQIKSRATIAVNDSISLLQKAKLEALERLDEFLMNDPLPCTYESDNPFEIDAVGDIS